MGNAVNRGNAQIEWKSCNAGNVGSEECRKTGNAGKAWNAGNARNARNTGKEENAGIE